MLRWGARCVLNAKVSVRSPSQIGALLDEIWPYFFLINIRLCMI